METTERIEPQAGNDVYLSIDKDLQEAVYNLLEQEIAGILYSKIVNIKEYNTAAGTASDILIPIDDVYFALINNNVLDLNHFSAEDASDVENRFSVPLEVNSKRYYPRWKAALAVQQQLQWMSCRRKCRII